MRLYIGGGHREVYLKGHGGLLRAQNDGYGNYIEGDEAVRDILQKLDMLVAVPPMTQAPAADLEAAYGPKPLGPASESAEGNTERSKEQSYEPEALDVENNREVVPETEQSLEPYLCKRHGIRHKPGSALYYACLSDQDSEEVEEEPVVKKAPTKAAKKR